MFSYCLYAFDHRNVDPSDADNRALKWLKNNDNNVVDLLLRDGRV
jgi:hypothetical protein